MSRVCAMPDCGFRRRRGSRHCTYCGGLVDQMVKMAGEESRDSGEMYVGRSKNPFERLADHAKKKGLTRTRILLSTKNPYRACAFESALIERLSHLHKVSNRTLESRGRLRIDVVNHVYIASRPKHTYR